MDLDDFNALLKAERSKYFYEKGPKTYIDLYYLSGLCNLKTRILCAKSVTRYPQLPE